MSEQIEMLDNDISSKLEDYVLKLHEENISNNIQGMCSDLALIYSNYISQIKIEGFLQIFHKILVKKVFEITNGMASVDVYNDNYEKLRKNSSKFADIAFIISDGKSILDNGKPIIKKKFIKNIKDIIIELMM